MAEKDDKVTDATKDAEDRDAKAKHGAPEVPTSDEAAAADRKGGADPEAKEAYEEYLDTATDAPAEGRIP